MGRTLTVMHLGIRVAIGTLLPGALLWLTFASVAAVGADADPLLGDLIRQRIEIPSDVQTLQVLEDRIHAHQLMLRVYTARDFRPFWINLDGATPAGANLARWLAVEPERHGLAAADYHLGAIDNLLAADEPPMLVDLELALTDAFFMLGSHLLAGRLNPENLTPEWRAARRHRDLVPVIERAVTLQQPGDALSALLPQNAGYARLVEQLRLLRQAQSSGGWRKVNDGPTLQEGDDHPRVIELGERLRSSGDFDGTPGATFGAELASAVRRFQSRHGLSVDGVVGPRTLKALNVSAGERIEQLIVNLERWRWLPENLGERYVIVNIAGFWLDAVAGDETHLSMRVIVGQPYRRTPVFSSAISYLVFNPSWSVPRSIAVKDKLPLIKADPGYLSRYGYSLLQGWGSSERVIDPLTVDWQAVDATNFDFRLRQAPGPHNALGRVKFMFPNEFAVYLHDTPSRELFSRDSRPFSSGCIRLERPLELAELLLAEDPSWNRSAIDRAIGGGRERAVRLPREMPVHLLYWTAWVDADGVLQLRDDIYGRDAHARRFLRAAPPG